jgi:hypothetical protein
MVLQALNFIRPRKPTQLLTAWKIGSQHDLRDKNHKWRVEAGVQALLKTIDNNSPEGISPCDLQKFINSLKLSCRYYTADS